MYLLPLIITGLLLFLTVSSSVDVISTWFDLNWFLSFSLLLNVIIFVKKFNKKHKEVFKSKVKF